MLSGGKTLSLVIDKRPNWSRGSGFVFTATPKFKNTKKIADN